MKKPEETTIAVGMSGGVDSSVTAAILKDQGYNVFGVFFHMWDDEERRTGKAHKRACCSLESQTDARSVAKQLGIKLYTFNLKEEFKAAVVGDFIETYQSGETPNPCVRCNEYLKFGAALEKINELGADYFATGHYARIKKDDNGIFHLYESKDKLKDQTYFMHRLSQEQLSHVMFPLAGLEKKEVRVLAAKYGLPTAKKVESAGLCFIASGNVSAFIQKNILSSRGEIRDVATKDVLGLHDGLEKYTIGQRKGMKLPGGPWFVYKKDGMNNVLWVTRDEEILGESSCVVENIHWISGSEPVLPLEVDCRIRYHSDAVAATIIKEKNKYIVTFKEPQRAVTPGQSAVFYKDTECLGGAIIKRV